MADDAPIDVTIKIIGDFDHEQTPVCAHRSCWHCRQVDAVTIKSPPPLSHHEALRYSTCIASRGGGWSWCALGFVLRLGEYEIYLGPDRRIVSKHIEPDRRKIPPPVPKEKP